MLVRAVAGFVAAALTLMGGRAVEFARLGRSDADAMARVASEVRGGIDTIAAELRGTAHQAAVRPALLATAQPSPESTRTLFDLARSALGTAPVGRSAVTIYGSSGTPLAWSGRPSDVPADRLRGSAALFMAPGPIGPRLIYTEPLLNDATPRARAGTIAVERVLGVAEGGSPAAAGAITLATSLVPVRLRGRYEGAGESPQLYRFLVPDPDGRALLDAEVDPAALAALRARYRSTAVALALAVLACAMLVICVPVDEWRRARGTWSELAIASQRARGATVHRASTDRRGCARGVAVGGSGARASPHPCALPIAGGRVRDGKPAAGDGCTRRRSARAAAAARPAPARTRRHSRRRARLRRHAPGRRPCGLGHPGCAPLVARAPADTRAPSTPCSSRCIRSSRNGSPSCSGSLRSTRPRCGARS